jgi:hypothetical protein
LCDVIPPGALSSLFASGGFNASGFIVRPPGQVAGDIIDGVLNAPPGVLLQLDTTVTGLSTLAFPADRRNIAAQVGAGATMSVPTITANASATQGGGRMIVGAGAQFTGQSVHVLAAAALTWTLAEPTTGPPSSVTTASIEAFNLGDGASINVVGTPRTVFSFPPTAASAQGGQGASVQVSGGVRVQGFSGALPINVAGDSASDDQSVQVASGSSWTAGGPILGSSAQVQVRGDAHFTGHVIEPRLSVNEGARAFIAADGSTPIRCGNLSLVAAASARAEGGRLVVNGSASSAGSQIYFARLQSCPSGAQVQFNVAVGQTPAAAIDAGFTLFNYGVDGASPSTFRCGISVCDAAGGNCLAVSNPNAAAASGRRLLAAAAGVATFGSTSLTVASSDGTDGAASVSAAVSVVALAAAAFAALVASRA